MNEDKSMQGFINTGETHLKPLNDFRNFIKKLREDPNARADYNRFGRAVYKVGGLGPFLSSARVEIFTKLLEAESEFKANGGSQLLADEQILAIQNEWDKDFDLEQTAIQIAQKFGRLKEFRMEKSKVLHQEILQEVLEEFASKSSHNLDFASVSNLITKSVEIYANAVKSRAEFQIKEEISKILSDKTAKQREDEGDVY